MLWPLYLHELSILTVWFVLQKRAHLANQHMLLIHKVVEMPVCFDLLKHKRLATSAWCQRTERKGELYCQAS